MRLRKKKPKPVPEPEIDESEEAAEPVLIGTEHSIVEGVYWGPDGYGGVTKCADMKEAIATAERDFRLGYGKRHTPGTGEVRLVETVTKVYVVERKEITNAERNERADGIVDAAN